MTETNHAEEHKPSPFHTMIGFIVAAVIGGSYLYILNYLLSS